MAQHRHVSRYLLSFLGAVLCLAQANDVLAQPSFLLDSTFTGTPDTSRAFITPADINGDGLPDLFVTRGAAYNRGDGRFSNVLRVGDLSTDRQPGVGDLNDDGFVDFVLPDFTLQTITLITNESGLLKAGPVISLAGLVPTPVFPTAISAGDLNGDGITDLAVASRQPLGPLIALTNGGSGNFSAMAVITNGFFGPVSARVADVNGDGRPDMLCADTRSSVAVFTNSAGTNFVQSCIVSNFAGFATSMMRVVGDVADVNGDGLPDLLSPSISSNAAPFLNLLKVATNAGNGVFLPASVLAVGTLVTNQPRGAIVIAAEFNQDGKVDCVFQSEPDDRFVVATNRGDGTFAIARTMVTATERLGIAVADFNRDGLADLASGSTDGLVQVYLNTTAPAAPHMQITISSTQSNVVYWPGVPGQFELQATTNVASTNWQTVSDGVPVTGFMLPTTQPARFFRLQAK